MAFLTFPIRNETTSHPIREIFRHICKARKPPCRERVAFFLLFPSIYSFAEEACAHIIYIYTKCHHNGSHFCFHPISSLGATAILSPVLCQLHCRHPHQQPVAVVVIYILRTFAPKLSIVTLVFAMFADTMDSFNECEMAVCHELHSAPDTPDALTGGIAFHARSSNSFGNYLCLASHPLVSVFLPSAEKKRHL
jgi:hypothetical protein